MVRKMFASFIFDSTLFLYPCLKKFPQELVDRRFYLWGVCVWVLGEGVEGGGGDIILSERDNTLRPADKIFMLLYNMN